MTFDESAVFVQRAPIEPFERLVDLLAGDGAGFQCRVRETDAQILHQFGDLLDTLVGELMEKHQRSGELFVELLVCRGAGFRVHGLIEPSQRNTWRLRAGVGGWLRLRDIRFARRPPAWTDLPERIQIRCALSHNPTGLVLRSAKSIAPGNWRYGCAPIAGVGARQQEVRNHDPERCLADSCARVRKS